MENQRKEKHPDVTQSGIDRERGPDKSRYESQSNPGGDMPTSDDLGDMPAGRPDGISSQGNQVRPQGNF